MGAKIEEEMNYGWKAIHVAVYQNDFITLQELVKYGANLDSTTKWFDILLEDLYFFFGLFLIFLQIVNKNLQVLCQTL